MLREAGPAEDMRPWDSALKSQARNENRKMGTTFTPRAEPGYGCVHSFDPSLISPGFMPKTRLPTLVSGKWGQSGHLEVVKGFLGRNV